MTQVSASLYLCSFMESVFGIKIVLLPNTTQQTINVNAEHISVERVLDHITAKSLIYIYWMVFGIRMILLPNKQSQLSLQCLVVFGIRMVLLPNKAQQVWHLF